MTLFQTLILLQLAGMLVYGFVVIFYPTVPVRRDDWIFLIAVLVVSVAWPVLLPMRIFNTLQKARRASRGG